MTGEAKNTNTQVGAQSILRSILGANKIAHMERVARATRMRELLSKLGNAAKDMQPHERAAFVELVQLARNEHTAAMDEQATHAELDTIRDLVDSALNGLQEMREGHEHLKDMLMSKSGVTDPAHSADAGEVSVWKRLIQQPKKFQGQG